MIQRNENQFLRIVDRFIKRGDQPKALKHPIRCDHCDKATRMTVYSTVPARCYQFTLICRNCKAVARMAITISGNRLCALRERMAEGVRA